VELMIRSAAGEPLGITQQDVMLTGWAIESRIYAEDPYRGFLPSTGRLVRYRPPPEGRRGDVTLRNDTGVYEGGEISVYYDPMIAKLCTHAPSRAQAVDAMAEALDEFRIEGISHNIPFLAAIMHSPRFRAGQLSTGFIAEEFPEGFHGWPLDDERRRRFAAAAVAARIVRAARSSRISGTLNGALAANDRWIVNLDGEDILAGPVSLNGQRLTVCLNGTQYEAEVNWDPAKPQMVVAERGAQHVFQISRERGGYRLSQGGTSVVISVRRPEAAKLAALMLKKAAADMSKFLLCPMPGLMVSVNVSEGQEVKAGETLAVVEAMKMENVLRSERDGTVKKIKVHRGDSLAVDDVILEFA
jgi:propionyl-CoA carboxylase alpha chain